MERTSCHTHPRPTTPFTVLIVPHISDTYLILYALQSPFCSRPRMHTGRSRYFVKARASDAVEPPGAAPTLTTLEEHYQAALMGEEDGPKPALDASNPTSKSIAQSLDVSDNPEPNRPVTNGSAVSSEKRRISVPFFTKLMAGSK
ncbi:MAG: hypothetical protein Q9177_002180 [Variospora cf. flavescens]